MVEPCFFPAGDSPGLAGTVEVPGAGVPEGVPGVDVPVAGAPVAEFPVVDIPIDGIPVAGVPPNAEVPGNPV